MRALLMGCVVLAAGCGAANEEKKPAAVAFSLEAPLPLELLNGQSLKRDVTVSWSREEHEDLDVHVAVDPDEQGVSARAEPARLAGGAGPIHLTIRAEETTAPGEYRVTITAKAVRSGAEAKTLAVAMVPRRE